MALWCHTHPLLCHWPGATSKTRLMGKVLPGERLCAARRVLGMLGTFDPLAREEPVIKFLHQLWSDESGQDIAEYAVMLAVILVIVVGTIRLIGSNANTVFSQVGSAIQ